MAVISATRKRSCRVNRRRFILIYCQHMKDRFFFRPEICLALLIYETLAWFLIQQELVFMFLKFKGKNGSILFFLIYILARMFSCCLCSTFSLPK